MEGVLDCHRVAALYSEVLDDSQVGGGRRLRHPDVVATADAHEAVDETQPGEMTLDPCSGRAGGNPNRDCELLDLVKPRDNARSNAFKRLKLVTSTATSVQDGLPVRSMFHAPLEGFGGIVAVGPDDRLPRP